jgi:hypothetical protein
VIELCKTDPAKNCGPVWTTQAACPDGQGCNSDGTKCVGIVDHCSDPAECGCGCTCTNQNVCGNCMGALPPSCKADDDCGPSCSGFHCVGGQCAAPVCVPGQDQTCNEDPKQQSFAGTCLPNRTCVCNPGTAKLPDGKCGSNGPK